MKKLVLVPDHYYNCPICNQPCSQEEVEGYQTVLKKQGTCHQFLCINPLPNNPLHYYSHIVEKSEPTRIAYQEFSINASLDDKLKYYLFGIDLVNQRTLIKNSSSDEPLELNFVIQPDFPALDSLVKKIRTAIVFS